MDEAIKSCISEQSPGIETNAACFFLPCIRIGSGSSRSPKHEQDMKAREEPPEIVQERHRQNGNDDDEEHHDFPSSQELIEAAQSGDEARLESVLAAPQVNVNAKEPNSSAFTALHHAARANDDRVLKLLLSCPDIDVDARDGLSRTPLMLASELGHIHAVELLLQQRADLLICDKAGFNCLHLAARGGHSDVITLLLEDQDFDGFWNKGVNESRQESAAAITKVNSGRIFSFPLSIRLQLMEEKTSEAKFTALHMAAKGGHVSIAVQLLRAYMTLTLKGSGFKNYPRDHDLMGRFLDHVKIVVSTIHSSESEECTASNNGASISHKLKSYWVSRPGDEWRREFSQMLHIERNDVDLRVERLAHVFGRTISYANSADSARRTVLHIVALKGAPRPRSARDAARCTGCAIERLLELGALNVNVPDIDGNTPLHLAGEVDNICLVRHALDAGLVPNLGASNWDGHMPLRSAFSHKLPLYRAPGKAPWTTVSSHNLLCGSFGRLRGLRGWEPDSRSVSELLEREVIVRLGELEGPDRGLLRAGSEMLWSLKELLERRRIAEDEDRTLRKGLELDDHYGGLTLLHYAAFRGFPKEMQRLLKLPKFRNLANMGSHGTGQSALHLAVIEGQKEVVKLLLSQRRQLKLRTAEEDAFDRSPLELARASRAFYQAEAADAADAELWSRKVDDLKDIEKMLLDDVDVRQSVQRLVSLRRDYVATTNANVVGAALIACVTYGGWLQPPLGLQQLSFVPAQSATAPGIIPLAFAAIEYDSVQCFWVLNSLAFFAAAATVVSGAGALLRAATVTKTSMYCVADDVKHVQASFLRTSLLLVLAVSCLLGGFGAAGFAVLPPVLKYQAAMIVPISFGSILCLVCLYAFLHRFAHLLPRRLRRKLARWRLGPKPPPRRSSAVTSSYSSFEHGLYHRSSWSILGA
ncbi:hypothetical protein MPTK1_7g15040 [Marchantia polymorpha subsp. ruderalis]|uniref:PGG domain-containing protein n=2 Tax=Marchantia polymorpha TaxID=3197 RepID=A0AAF6BZR6_MARPO|nr:hypothetical protein MARPO_0009s0188 [Marchantia polymorpha]BBN17500.1 hypothetical protein Mp_7g15040 [Marchantia polymorpha subsp. ruderalis]|eukprot:PTQ47107.1 hypothetical protein MARPO_0009s0188 [Marchantia polymorpha]